MQNTDTRPPLPAVEIRDIDNQSMVDAGFQVIDQDLVRLQSKPLKARQVIIRLDGCILAHQFTNLRLRSRPSLPDQFIAFVAFGPDASGSVNGLQVRHDIMLAVPPSTGISLVSDPGYESMTFLLRPEDVSAHLKVRDLEDSFHLPQEVQVLHVGADSAGNLFAWGKRLVEVATADPELFNNKEQRAAAQADLVDTLLTTLSGTSKLEPERRERTRQLQSDIVRAAERHALAHADERLYVTDLCRAAGVSERTLEYAFRAVMALSPTAYLTRIRLHRVHQALLQARPGSTTVTEQALNWGFWHFGEFSRAYKDCFDELPSNTLRRSADQS
ncbi:helix-turn-helix domain-containing protein [Duganella sp. FT3S]|uniref:Helix-turn-helix domain-containing protein n=1 Tax=Rugamonas fusca TaxID=2758568 RepID=A0A7W2I5B0_9BURK|nr:helix-turn-helix domain-containing protein [Rugamonas fusca]MBA5604251.1 helix-turn-helix domain-containing protein [Rugamonas fusca]